MDKYSDPRCFVCNRTPEDHLAIQGHTYWSTADAFREAREHDRRVILAQTPEAAYVAQHRPY